MTSNFHCFHALPHKTLTRVLSDLTLQHTRTLEWKLPEGRHVVQMFAANPALTSPAEVFLSFFFFLSSSLWGLREKLKTRTLQPDFLHLSNSQFYHLRGIHTSVIQTLWATVSASVNLPSRVDKWEITEIRHRSTSNSTWHNQCYIVSYYDECEAISFLEFTAIYYKICYHNKNISILITMNK